jgi:hypothetical protein
MIFIFNKRNDLEDPSYALDLIIEGLPILKRQREF